VLTAAAESLRYAGIPSAVSASMLEKQVGRTLRSFMRSGRNAFPAPREFSQQLRALSAADPELAYYLEQSNRLSERLLENRKFASAATAR
jgi:hypothetical protein